jgi:hypothetical protein
MYGRHGFAPGQRNPALILSVQEKFLRADQGRVAGGERKQGVSAGETMLDTPAESLSGCKRESMRLKKFLSR